MEHFYSAEVFLVSVVWPFCTILLAVYYYLLLSVFCLTSQYISEVTSVLSCHQGGTFEDYCSKFLQAGCPFCQCRSQALKSGWAQGVGEGTEVPHEGPGAEPQWKPRGDAPEVRYIQCESKKIPPEIFWHFFPNG